MKAIDVFYLESEDISSVVVPRTKKFKIVWILLVTFIDYLLIYII